MTRRTLALLAIPLVGCASLIGATFDDAHLGGDGAAPDVADEHASDAAEPDVHDAAPFDPASIANLAFWIDAAYGVMVDADASNAVTTWYDRSGLSRHAVPAGGGTQSPKLVPGALAGEPVVHFSSADPDLLRATWSGPDGPALTMFLVARGYANSALRFQSNIGAFPFMIFPLDFVSDASSPSFRFDVAPAQPNYTALQTEFDGGAAVLSATWGADGAAATFLDGVLVEQRVGLDPALPSNQTLYIGGALPLLAQPSTRLPFADADVAEAIVYDKALDESARCAVEEYLLDKWAIAP